MKQFFHDLFYLPKHEKLTDRSFMKVVISSIAGITLCCLCLVSLTWAWFEDGAMSGRNSISSATFWAEVSIEKAEVSIKKKVDTPVVINDDENEAPVENNNDADDANESPDSEGQQSENDEGEVVVMRSGSPFLLTTVPVMTIENSSPQFPMTFKLEGSYTLVGLEAGKYKITVTPKGTAREFGGYLVIKAEGKDTLYTEQMTIGKDFVFTFEVDGTVNEYKLFCVWGSMPSGIDENYIIENELDPTKSDESSKESSATSSADSSDTSSTDSSDTSSTDSSDTSSTDSSDTSSTDSSVDSEVVSSSDESTNSVASEGASSVEETESTDTSLAETENTSSVEGDETLTVSSEESEVTSSEELEEPSIQEDSEHVSAEENLSEV